MCYTKHIQKEIIMQTNYIYKGCEFHLDETLFNDYLLDTVY